MAISYTQNEINFSNITKGVGLLKKYGNVQNADFTFENSNVYEDGIQPFINAVEIDWNGAQVAGQTLNTTGELFINQLRQEFAKRKKFAKVGEAIQR